MDSLLGKAAAVVDLSIAGTPLTDPEKDNRPKNDDKFVLTSFPSTLIHYPHIIVQENNNQLRRMDARVDQQEGPYSVKLTLKAKNNDHIFSIRDGLKAWLHDSYVTLRDGGFTEPSLDNAIPTRWDPTGKIKTMEMVITGTVYISREP